MYKLIEGEALVRLSDNAVIPVSPDNRDYVAYLAWVAEGNTAAPMDPVPVAVPHSVTRFQAKAALSDFGMLGNVEALMSAPETPMIYKLAWAEALSFERHSQTVAVMGLALDLSDSDLDDLFVAAAKISA